MHALLNLSFARPAAGGKVDLWPETPSTGDHADDNEVGRCRAEELVAYMQQRRAPMVYGHIAARIMERGVMGPMEVGFFSQCALLMMRGDPIVLPVPQPVAENVIPFVRPATSHR